MNYEVLFRVGEAEEPALGIRADQPFGAISVGDLVSGEVLPSEQVSIVPGDLFVVQSVEHMILYDHDWTRAEGFPTATSHRIVVRLTRAIPDAFTSGGSPEPS